MSATLDIADTVYCLIENVTWSVSDAITFAENNITLNCQGYTIQANLSSYYYGIYSSGYNNTVVENCTINGGFVYGIYFEDVDSGIIKNNTILNYKYEGIDAFSVTNLIIHNNTIIDYSAISFEALIVYGYGGTHPVMANVTISDNIISSLGEGIAIWSDSPPDTAYGFNIINNIVIGSDWGVIDIEALDTSIIGNNTFIYNGTDPGNWLAYIEGLTNSLVINNTFNYSNTSDTSNYAWPLYIDCWSFSEPPQNTTYYNNKIIGYNGIYIGYSAGNIFLENNITAEVWVNSTSSVPGLNYFNNSTSGNYYYTLNGTPAWQLYPIYDTNGDVWADMGALNTTIAPARWGGLNSSDFHPYTEKHMPPFALGVFYDINGVLWTVYYENNSMSMNISHEGTSVNITSDPVGGYMAVLRPDTLLSFYNYNALFINYTSGTIQTIPSTSIDSNASNSFYDPYAFAYTKQYPTLSLDSSSYYLLMLNNSSDTSLLKIFNHTTSPVISVNQTINVTTTWQTIANDNSLHTWYYPFPNNCGNDSYNISIYYDTGAASSLFATPDTTCYNKTSIANAKIAFEEKNNNMYFVQFNTYGRTYIYRLNDGMVYQINDTINSVSPFLFYDNNTFVFHATEDSGAYVYSCYFGAHPNCIKNTLANYGTPAVKVKGNGVTSTRNNTADIITYGYASSFNPVLLSFQTSTIDVKYICNNEVTFEQLPSNYRIFTSTNSVLMASGQTTWAYAIPSASLGLGTRRVYSLCTDGSNRQYFESNTSYIENAYTLNLSIGQYYSFQITDCYNLGVNDVKTTAQRYIAALSSWDTIEQAYSQVDGTATLFLEPSTPYIIILESSGRNTTSFSFSPSANITTIPVQIGCEGNVSPGIVREAVFDDLEYWIMPPGPGPLISNVNLGS